MNLDFKIAKDKLLHMIGGAVIALSVWLLFYSANFSAMINGLPIGFYAPAFGIIAALIIGGLKEHIIDRYFGGTVDSADRGATFVGGALAVAGVKLSYAFAIAMLASYGVQI